MQSQKPHPTFLSRNELSEMSVREPLLRKPSAANFTTAGKSTHPSVWRSCFADRRTTLCPIPSDDRLFARRANPIADRLPAQEEPARGILPISLMEQERRMSNPAQLLGIPGTR